MLPFRGLSIYHVCALCSNGRRYRHHFLYIRQSLRDPVEIWLTSVTPGHFLPKFCQTPRLSICLLFRIRPIAIAKHRLTVLSTLTSLLCVVMATQHRQLSELGHLATKYVHTVFNAITYGQTSQKNNRKMTLQQPNRQQC